MKNYLELYSLQLFFSLNVCVAKKRAIFFHFDFLIMIIMMMCEEKSNTEQII